MHVNWPLNIFFNEAAGRMQKFGQITRKEGVSEERLKKRERDKKKQLMVIDGREIVHISLSMKVTFHNKLHQNFAISKKLYSKCS